MVNLLLLALRLIMALLLYAFLGWALFTLWQSLRQQAQLANTRRIPPLKLLFQADDPSDAQTFTLPQVILGRDPACDVTLDNDTISAQHTRLSFHHNQWWVEDLGSTNGTFLDDQPVTTPTVLADGDRLRCGEVSGVVGLEERG